MKYRCIKCDVCDKDITNADIRFKFKRYKDDYVNYGDPDIFKWTKLDMCEECYNRFLQFLMHKSGECNE